MGGSGLASLYLMQSTLHFIMGVFIMGITSYYYSEDSNLFADNPAYLAFGFLALMAYSVVQTIRYFIMGIMAWIL